MAVPTSNAIIAASRDSDLLERFIALGSSMNLTQADITSARMRLASAPVDDQGNTVASVYEYANSQPRFRAGEDPAAVTDDHIRFALEQVMPPPSESTVS